MNRGDFAERAKAHFKRALSKATPVIIAGGNEEALRPFWAEALHNLFLEEGACPCRNKQHGQCFLELSSAAQDALFTDESGNELSFTSFMQIVNIFRHA